MDRMSETTANGFTVTLYRNGPEEAKAFSLSLSAKGSIDTWEQWSTADNAWDSFLYWSRAASDMPGE